MRRVRDYMSATKELYSLGGAKILYQNIDYKNELAG